MTPLGALMRDADLTSAPVALDYRQQRFTARLANACEGSKLKEVHDHPTASVRICKVIRKDHERGREAETMCWPSPDEEPAVKMVILSHKTAAKREGRRLARECDQSGRRGQDVVDKRIAIRRRQSCSRHSM